MTQDGQLVIHNDGDPMRMRLSGVTFSNKVSRTLELVDGAGRVVARQLIPTYAVPLHLQSFVIPHGTTRLTFTADPGPQPLGPNDARPASVFLSGLNSVVLPRWTVSSP
jgi:hypothetical protein